MSSPTPTANSASSLQQLRALTKLVADSGDLVSITTWQPIDATTNPSLLWQAAQNPEHHPLLTRLKQQHTDSSAPEASVSDSSSQVTKSSVSSKSRHSGLSSVSRQFAVQLGWQILQTIPGRVSTEVSANLSFNQLATEQAARQIIELYQQHNITAERVLIKIAATWEGIQAAKQLQREGIHCNLTLIFNLTQAAACADAGVTLISPFVGRISDWFQRQRQQPIDYLQPDQDPGVQSVKQIYAYLKQHHYTTEVMAASFRHPQQAIALAGCDAMTLAPAILEALHQQQIPVIRLLGGAEALTQAGETKPVLRTDPAHFRWAINQDDMANTLLADGIRRFHQDEQKLYQLLMTL